VSGISIYSGDPNELVELLPDRVSSRNWTWTFSKADNAKTPLYMTCFYSGTRIQFMKSLPLTVTSCTIKKVGTLICADSSS